MSRGLFHSVTKTKRSVLVVGILVMLFGLLYVMSASSTNPKTMVSHKEGGGQYPLWLSDDTVIYLPVDANRRDGIYSVDVNTGKRILLTKGSFLSPEAFDPETGRLYFLDSRDIWGLDLETKLKSMIFDTFPVHSLSISRKGRLAVVLHDGSGVYNLALLDLAGSKAKVERLTSYTKSSESMYPGLPVQWTQDGNALLFGLSVGEGSGRRFSVVQMDVNERKMMESIIPEEGTSGFALAPDGKRFAFATGKHLYVGAIGSEPVPATSDYMFAGPRGMAWSPDSCRLAYSAENNDLKMLTVCSN